MPKQDPIFLIVIALLTLFVIIINSIQNEKIIKKSLFVAFINLALSTVVFFVYDKITEDSNLEDVYFGYTIFNYLFFIFSFIMTFRSSMLKANHYQLFIKSIRESSWNAYYVVDRRERIKDISESLLNEIGLTKEEVLGKRLFDVFDKTVRFLKLNGVEINNKSLKGRYLDYRKSAEIGDSEIEELVFLNHEGKESVLKVMLQPVFVFGRYKGRTIAGEVRSDFSMLGVEKKLTKNQEEFDSVSKQFNAVLKVSSEGIYRIDLESKNIGVNDTLAKMLKLPSNIMNISDFRNLIEPSDLSKYLIILSELNQNKPSFKVRYRILVEGVYVWVEEHGTRLFDDTYTSTIIGAINIVQVKHFRASNIDSLDQVEDADNLAVTLNKLIAENRHYYLMLFEVSNIPEINDRHGWQVGNMFLANYVEKIKAGFMTENGSLYRISGLQFAVIITNPIKMDIVRKGVAKRSDFLDDEITYGSINERLIVKAGISVSEQDGTVGEHLYQAAYQALQITKNPRFTHNAAFYEDVIENGK